MLTPPNSMGEQLLGQLTRSLNNLNLRNSQLYNSGTICQYLLSLFLALFFSSFITLFDNQRLVLIHTDHIFLKAVTGTYRTNGYSLFATSSSSLCFLVYDIHTQYVTRLIPLAHSALLILGVNVHICSVHLLHHKLPDLF